MQNKGAYKTIKDWAEDPVGFHRSIMLIKEKFIFDGFIFNRFSIDIPLVRETINTIQNLLWKKSNCYLLHGAEELETECKADIEKLFQETKALSEGKMIYSDRCQPKLVTYPYADTIECAIGFADLSEKIHRYKFYKNLFNQFETIGDSEIQQDIDNLRVMINANLPISEKMDQLSTWDKTYTQKKLQRECKPFDTYHINKAMNLPGYYHRQFKKLVMDDLIYADTINHTIIIPSFASYDLDFFTHTRQAPAYVMGLLEMPYLYADGYRHTCHEFAMHDLKHAWDMELFRIRSYSDRNQSPEESIDEQERIANYIHTQIDKIKDINMKKCLKLLLFELVHEEGHTYNLADLRDGLEEKSIYCNEFLSRLFGQKVNSRFFGPSTHAHYANALLFFQQGKNLLLHMIDKAHIAFDIPFQDIAYTTNYHGNCEVRSGEIQKQTKLEDSRFITPNISIKRK